jgi:hypothetical protein
MQNCVCVGVNLLVGTESGLMLLDRSGQGKVYPLISRRRFQQMDVLEGLNVLVTISGTHTHTHTQLLYIDGNTDIQTRARHTHTLLYTFTTRTWLGLISKVLLLTYKGLHGLAPIYLSDLVLPYIPTCTLLSQDAGLLIVQRISKQTAGGRVFSYRAQFSWNGLPIHVRDADLVSTLIKSLLKTHLFSRSYD